MRFFLEIAYDGSEFFGWQVQPDKVSVQGTMNKVLQTIFQEKIHVVGCGRTDAGVHASQFYLHFDCTKAPYENLVYKLNSMLPETIAVKRCIRVKDDQHTRFDATQRSYTYHIHFQKNPFLRHHSYYCYFKNLDVEAMQRVASSLKKYKDFEPLSKFNEDNNTTLCNIYSCELKPTENGLVFQITADRYLHNMIRRIVGLLVNVGRGKITEQEVERVMTNIGEFKLNLVAPPQGLFLSAIEYPYIK